MTPTMALGSTLQTTLCFSRAFIQTKGPQLRSQTGTLLGRGRRMRSDKIGNRGVKHLVCAEATETSDNLEATKGVKSMSVTGVLFVCLGNVCRSPTAEAVFKSVIQRRNMEDRFQVDSCGTGGGNPNWYLDGGWSYHEGDPADDRMRDAASKRDIVLTSRSRPLRASDLKTFDMLVAMDADNVEEMKTAIRHWSQRDASLSQAIDKIVLMSDFCTQEQFKSIGHVPDPYYGGDSGFELVLDLLTDACEGLLETLVQKQKL